MKMLAIRNGILGDEFPLENGQGVGETPLARLGDNSVIEFPDSPGQRPARSSPPPLLRPLSCPSPFTVIAASIFERVGSFQMNKEDTPEPKPVPYPFRFNPLFCPRCLALRTFKSDLNYAFP